jgi:hypothetical protein
MQSDYTFLNDHSYSIRVDYEKLSLKKPPRGTTNRSNKTKSTNRTVSIDRSSSDKENNLSVPIINTLGNKRKPSMKKKTNGARLTGKKQKNKTSSKTSTKSTQNSKKTIIKPLKSHVMDQNDAPPSLSIEERVKLRRTKPLLTPIKAVLNKKPIKRIHLSKSKNIIKPKKFFLGSGLDLDNIVLGNRQRRSVQT